MEKLKDQIIEALKQLGKEVTEIDYKKLMILNDAELAKAGALISETVHQVESLASSTGALSGEDKLNLAVDVLNTFIDIPGVPEWVERIAFKIVVSLIVKTLNRKLGKKWGETDAQGQKQP